MSTLGPDGTPQAARVYLATTSQLELIFYTLQTNRKCLNLRRDPRIAVVIGWDGDKTVQYEGLAIEVEGSALGPTKEAYLDALPTRAQNLQWPGLTFFRVKPVWIRFSDYGQSWRVDEISFPENKPKQKPGRRFFRSLFNP